MLLVYRFRLPGFPIQISPSIIGNLWKLVVCVCVCSFSWWGGKIVPRMCRSAKRLPLFLSLSCTKYILRRESSVDRVIFFLLANEIRTTPIRNYACTDWKMNKQFNLSTGEHLTGWKEGVGMERRGKEWQNSHYHSNSPSFEHSSSFDLYQWLCILLIAKVSERPREIATEAKRARRDTNR